MRDDLHPGHDDTMPDIPAGERIRDFDDPGQFLEELGEDMGVAEATGGAFPSYRPGTHVYLIDIDRTLRITVTPDYAFTLLHLGNHDLDLLDSGPTTLQAAGILPYLRDYIDNQDRTITTTSVHYPPPDTSAPTVHTTVAGLADRLNRNVLFTDTRIQWPGNTIAVVLGDGNIESHTPAGLETLTAAEFLTRLDAESPSDVTIHGPDDPTDWGDEQHSLDAILTNLAAARGLGLEQLRGDLAGHLETYFDRYIQDITTHEIDIAQARENAWRRGFDKGPFVDDDTARGVEDARRIEFDNTIITARVGALNTEIAALRSGLATDNRSIAYSGLHFILPIVTAQPGTLANSVFIQRGITRHALINDPTPGALVYYFLQHPDKHAYRHGTTPTRHIHAATIPGVTGQGSQFDAPVPGAPPIGAGNYCAAVGLRYAKAKNPNTPITPPAGDTYALSGMSAGEFNGYAHAELQVFDSHDLIGEHLLGLGDGAMALVVDGYHGPGDEYGVGAHHTVFYNESGTVMVHDPSSPGRDYPLREHPIADIRVITAILFAPDGVWQTIPGGVDGVTVLGAVLIGAPHSPADAPVRDLTSKQGEALEQFAIDEDYTAAARRLGVTSSSTVHRHVAAAVRRLGAADVGQAVDWQLEAVGRGVGVEQVAREARQ
ncbi:hypothetical protein, partial [Nocardia sp. NPDC005998]|uniref:helix-turn-helix transcriptional regulator n=1 Tax=Nocardia sp. NPDC005998 TaxID=3156894 RepID=UPI0033A932A7